MLAEKAVVALTALTRLESERALATHETAGIVFIASDRGLGVLLISDGPGGSQQTAQPRRLRAKT